MSSSRKKKIIIILNRLVIGGQALDTVPLIYHLKDEFDILVLYGQKEHDEEEALFLLQQYPGINLKKIKHFKRSINVFNDALAFITIYKEIKKFSCSIVHTHGFKSGFIGRIAAKAAHVPCIIHTFHGHLFHSYYNHFISKFIIKFERALGKITTYIIAISDTQKKELTEKYNIIPAQKITVIYLGVDENFVLQNNAANRNTFRQEYMLGENEVAIAIIGRIVAVKNYELFIKVVERTLKNTDAPVKFFVIGDGLLKAFIQNELDARNILWCNKNSFNKNAAVIFTSWISDISLAVPGVDIVVLTSHNEGTPMSLIEAQFFGKPVVATDVGGVADTFINGETGFLVPPDDAEIFWQKLSLLIQNKSLRENMHKKTFNFSKERFSKQKEIDSFKSLYKNC